MMRDIIYRRPRHEHTNNLVSLIFWKTCRHKIEAFCDNKFFLLPVLSCKCFLVGFKDVNEPPVPQQVQRKKHVFQALTPE